MAAARGIVFVALFATDVVLSLLLGLVVPLFAYLAEGGFTSGLSALSSVPFFVFDLLFRRNDFFGLLQFVSVFAYATLTTSIWVFLYVLAATLIRVARRAQTGVRLLQWGLNLDQPFVSIGIVLILVVTALFLPIAIYNVI